MFEYADVDALKILLQASAAAESLQLRFAELHQRRAELLSDQRQLEAERSAFEQRAGEFAAEVARARAEHREQSAELEQRLQRCVQQEEQQERLGNELRAARRTLSEERVALRQSVRAELDSERLKLGQERAVLESERQRLREQSESDRSEHAERMQRLADELRQEKQRLADQAREQIAQEVAQLARREQEQQVVWEQQQG
ncbi:MAG: hypothetical protein ACKPJD_01660, partial [Planctomycetaceae bacterium]